MFVLPVPAVTDVATTAAVTQGLNDNVVQTNEADGTVSRNAAFFTGALGTFTIYNAGATGDGYILRLRGRAQAYEPIGDFDQSPDGTGEVSWSAAKGLSRFVSLRTTLTTTISRVSSARVTGQSLLFQLDPAAFNSTFAVANANVALIEELGKKTRLVESAGLTTTATVAAAPFQLADGLELERQGIDGMQPQGGVSVYRDLSERDTVNAGVLYTYTYSPYALDIRSTPPRLAGPQRIHQVIPSVGYLHALSEHWTSVSQLGVSFTTPPTFADDRSAILFPTASQDLRYTAQDLSMVAQANVTYGSVVPRLGQGPSAGAVFLAFGNPFHDVALKRLMFVSRGQATYSSLRASTDASNQIIAVGGAIQARYALNSWLGVLGAYDLLFADVSTDVPGAVPPPAYIRQVFFVGLSGYFSSNTTLLTPIQVMETPFQPG